ncbi:MAG: sensor histidine kinase [Phormidesmis sp.]
MTALTSTNIEKDGADAGGASQSGDADQAAIDQIKSLERTNRILTKRLAKSERTRAELEEARHYQEKLLKVALKGAEGDRAELAAAQVQLISLNQALENRIEVETAALDKATDSLEQAKVQVVKSEKFSTLGELVAGVAHEINNPIGCITSNISFVKEYGQQLIEHIELLQSVLNAHKATVSPNKLEEVSDHAEEIDLAYVVEDFPNLIASIATSGERIKAISQSLRTFARADTAEKQPYDLHKGIDGTLLILRHRLKAVGHKAAITVSKNYGQIPTISCYPGQINQVFMNILANAIDAMDEGTATNHQRDISITTSMDEQSVVITIADTAGGMPDDVITHIFESQFTTKTAGKGTGLGLSIAHEIVTKNHLGQIECTSDIGQGTTFTITLPFE